MRIGYPIQRHKVHEWICLYVGGADLSWKSSKQICIARSTIELVLITLDKAGEEAEWLCERSRSSRPSPRGHSVLHFLKGIEPL